MLECKLHALWYRCFFEAQKTQIHQQNARIKIIFLLNKTVSDNFILHVKVETNIKRGNCAECVISEFNTPKFAYVCIDDSIGFNVNCPFNVCRKNLRN